MSKLSTVIREFTNDEIELIYKLANLLTGTHQEGQYRKQIIISNIRQRMRYCAAETLSQYLALAEQSDQEFESLISSLTIHTTSWFREFAHFQRVEKMLLERFRQSGTNLSIKLLSLGCSSGEEPYSFALLFEDLRQRHPGFDYRIIGIDIDPVSIKKAIRGVYQLTSLSGKMEERFAKHLLLGSNSQTQGLFTLTKEIRARVQFATGSLLELKKVNLTNFDLVICRNVLIYFDKNKIEAIVHNIEDLLNEGGWMVLGHSEALSHANPSFQSLANAIYAKQSIKNAQGPASRRVLVVDDSLTTRRVLEKMLVKHGFCVSLAASADEADQLMKSQSFDLVTLDLNMPEKDGLTWLRELREKCSRTPVIIISATSASEAQKVLRALEHGALDYIDKQDLFANSDYLAKSIAALIDGKDNNDSQGTIIHSDDQAHTPVNDLQLTHPSVILIGASTGGTEALTRLLEKMPGHTPPIVVVQHITPAFARPFAERLSAISQLTLEDPRDRPLLKPGHLYMAQGDYHIDLMPRGKALGLTATFNNPVNGHRPSVDHMLLSLTNVDHATMAILLTGMGSDGAAGMLWIKEKGGMTLAQSQKSCVVFGMPKAAIALNAIQFTGDIAAIREKINLAIGH